MNKITIVIAMALAFLASASSAYPAPRGESALRTSGSGARALRADLLEGKDEVERRTSRIANRLVPFCDDASFSSQVQGKTSDREENESSARTEVIQSFEEQDEIKCQSRNYWKPISHRYKDGRSDDRSRKRSLDQESYDRWNTLAVPIISDDGRWVAYTVSSALGAGELVVRSTQDETEFRVSRGSLLRGDSGDPWMKGVQRDLRRTEFAAASRSVVFSIAPSTILDGDRESNSWEMYQNSLGIMELPNGKITKFSGVSSFALPDFNRRYLAYLVKGRSSGASLDGGAIQHSVLVLKDLAANSQATIKDVAQYVFDKRGRYISYTTNDLKSKRSGVYLRRISDGRTWTVAEGPGSYESLVFDEKGKRLAFLFNPSAEGVSSSLYCVSLREVRTVVAVSDEDLRSRNLVIADGQGIEFARNSTAITFGLSVASPKNLAAAPTLMAQFELWRWDESSPLGKKFSAEPVYLAIYNILTQQWVKLEGIKSSRVLLPDVGRVAVGIDSAPYKMASIWRYQTPLDVYLIDVLSGESKLFRRGLKAATSKSPRGHFPRVALSTGGRYLIYFENKRWWSLNLTNKSLVNLTGSILPDMNFGVTGYPGVTGAYGIAGWTEGDQRVLVYDEYDIWEMDPDGIVAPRNLTWRVGRKNNIIFRLWDDYALALNAPSGAEEYLPRDEQYINTNDPLLLIGRDNDTMASGLWSALVEAGQAPQKILMLDKRITPVAKAKRADRYLFTQETFREYPDLWVGSSAGQFNRISDINPQQREYSWGTAELVVLKNEFGTELRGRLYKPDNFDSGKKYPMLVSVYQVQSQDLHRYFSPYPQFAAPELPVFVSRGYLHFFPDIKPQAPYPGQSAVAAVIPAVRALIERGFVDPARVCVSGHSFGGYEINFIITQTNMFRCAISAAGISDTVSLYGDPASTRGAVLVEGGQLRHDSSIWEKPFIYISNSPLFFANNVRTPLLMMHNDNDGMPYSQSFEFFNGLRRNGRRAWLINYRGEGHQLVQHVNRIDWGRRTQEFLDFYLTDGPMPHWMGTANMGPLRQAKPRVEGSE